MNKVVKTPISPWVVVAGATVVGTILRWWNLGTSSFWHDEGFTVMMAQLSPIEIWERTARDVHPPLYYLLLHYWMNFFGTNEIAVRSLSLVCTVAIIPLTYLLVCRLWNQRGAQLAAVFVACGPMLVRYGQEARMYGLVAFLTLLAVYALVRAVQNGQGRWWVIYSLSLAAAVYTHYYSVFVLPALFLFITLSTNRLKQRGWWDYRWWVSNIVALLIFAPWIPNAINQLTRDKNFSWIPATNVSTLPNSLIQFMTLGGSVDLSTITKVGIGVIFTGLLLLAWHTARRQRPYFLFFGLYALAGPILVYLGSMTGSPYLDRYFIFATVGFYSLLGLMISLLGPKAQRAALAVVMTLFGVGYVVIYPHNPHNMNAIGHYIGERYQPGDYLLSDVFLSYFDFSHYNRTGATAHLWEAGGIDGYGESSLLQKRESELVVRDLNTIHPASGRVWVISKTDKQGSKGHTPTNWTAVGTEKVFADNGAQLYLVAPRSHN